MHRSKTNPLRIDNKGVFRYFSL